MNVYWGVFGYSDFLHLSDRLISFEDLVVPLGGVCRFDGGNRFALVAHDVGFVSSGGWDLRRMSFGRCRNLHFLLVCTCQLHIFAE